jgi:tripartite-type tricarboxylate transporter receptor subunit TctC
VVSLNTKVLIGLEEFMIKRMLIATCTVVVLNASAARAQDVAAFYRGKQLRLVVGSAVGGAYDLYARALARQIVHYIPGNPTVIVQNQPAAGGMVMTNQIYNQGPKDGTVIGVPLNGIPTAPMLQAGAQFDAAKLNWIGSANREAYVGFVWHTAPIMRLEDATNREVLVGSTTVGTTMNDFPLLLNDLFGFKFKIVRGYQGTPQINLAIERGEIQGKAGVGWASVKALAQNWIDEKKIRILVQYNAEPYPELPGVPLVMSLAKTDAERQAMRLLFARTEYARPFFLPPEVPAERVEAMRRAFDATMKDKAFLEEAAKLQLEVTPMTGEAVQTLVGELARTPPAVATRVRTALEAAK